MALPVNGSTHLIPAYYSFIDPERMKGWVGLVGWPVADGLPTLVVTHQLQVERRTGKVRQSETDALPLCHATNCWGTYFPLKLRYKLSETLDWDYFNDFSQTNCLSIYRTDLRQISRFDRIIIIDDQSEIIFDPSRDVATATNFSWLYLLNYWIPVTFGGRR